MKIISRTVSRMVILCCSLILPLKDGCAVEAARFFESTDYGLAFQLPPDVKATEHSRCGDFSAPIRTVPAFGISLDAPCEPDEARAWQWESECVHPIGTIYIYPSVIEEIVPHRTEVTKSSTIEIRSGIDFVRNEEVHHGAGQTSYEVHYRTYKNRYCYEFEARTGRDFKVNELFNRVLETVKLSTPALHSTFQPIDLHNPSVSGVVGTGRWRKNQTIKIELSNGQSLEFRPDRNTEYSYGGFFSGFHIIERVLRNKELFLIHQGTGNKTTLTTYPIVSPDGTRFVTSCRNSLLERNSLVIWQIAGSTIREEHRFQYQTEVPVEVKWKDENTFVFWVRPRTFSDIGILHIATIKESEWKESSITNESED